MTELQRVRTILRAAFDDEVTRIIERELAEDEATYARLRAGVRQVISGLDAPLWLTAAVAAGVLAYLGALAEGINGRRASA